MRRVACSQACGMKGYPRRLKRPAADFAVARAPGLGTSAVSLIPGKDTVLGALTCGWLLAIFVMGGSARGDVALLPVLRPLAVLALAAGLYVAPAAFFRRQAPALALVGALFALPLLQLLPLPPGIWQTLPQRGLVAEIDAWSGIGNVWRPLSLTPGATWNAFWSLFVPTSVFILVLQLERRGKVMVLSCVLVAGGLSAALGLVQVTGDVEGTLSFYAVTNRGSAVGLFANRNHQALLLAMMIPMTFVLASLRTARRSGEGRHRLVTALRRWSLSVLVSAALLSLLLITGSRAGILLCAVALPAIAWIIAPCRPERSGWSVTAAALVWSALLGAAVFLDRDLALDRLAESNPALDARAAILPVILPLLRDVIFVGTGLGSFDRSYLIHEPDSLLGPSYMNHAHNDWLELAMTGGLPALFLLFAMACLVLRSAYSAMRAVSPDPEASMMTRLALVILVMIGLHSLGDYPLRVPSISAVAAVAIAFALPYHPRVEKNQNENQSEN